MARIDPSAVWDFAREVVGRGKSDHGRTLATVTRIGADGTVWVTTGDGGEAPAMSVAAGVSIGDTVALEWDGSSMGVRANVSDPPPAGNVVVKQVDAIRTEVVETAALVADKASVGQLEAESARIDSLQAATADIDTIRANSAKVANLTAQQLEADHATISTLDTNYMHANMSNSDVAWISNGVIANGAITNAMINGVSANKLTAGTINGDVINVTNLNANNITTGTINGQRIGTGSLSLDKLSEDVYTETEVDDKLSTMQAEIDGAIETWTGTEVPTLNNAPASGWTTDAIKDTHVGDVYFVVNSQSQQNGYNYRFTKSGSTYSWQLIKDNDVTNALQRLTIAEGKITTFDSDISTLKTDTGTLTTKTESLETRMSDAEEDILDKVDTTTFNEVSNTVDQHTQTITQHTTAISKKADNSTVTAVTNRVSKNEQDISGINTTIGSLQTTVESKADGSTVTTISDKLNQTADTVDGHTSQLTSVTAKMNTVANPNLSPFLSREFDDVYSAATNPSGYWLRTPLYATMLEDGWAHIECNNSSGTGSTWVTQYVSTEWQQANSPIKMGDVTYTALMEVRNVVVSGSAFVYPLTATTSNNTGMFGTMVKGPGGGTGQSAPITDGSFYSVAKTRSDFSNVVTVTRSLLEVQSGATLSCDIRISLYEGEYSGPYKPYVDQALRTNLTSLQTDYATFKQTTTAFESTIGTTIDEKIADISVGGRNLLKLSDTLDSSCWVLNSATMTDGVATVTKAASGESRIYQMPASGYWAWEANTDYVVSVEAKASAADGMIRLAPYGAGSSGMTFDITTGWKRYEYAFTSTASPTTGSMSFFNNGATDSVVQFRLPKLEKGNKATDWTPAPEDIETRVSTAESSITQNAQNIELKVSKDGVISSINQSAESVKIQASKVEIDGTAVFNAAKSKLDAAYDAKGAAATAESNAKANAVKRTQRIWYRKSASGAPSTPGTASSDWVTKADDGNDAWTKMHVAISSTHKYIYTCEQYEMANGTVGYTSVLLDNTITVIDGGNIITGSVTANKLNASDINASNSLTIGALSTSAQDDILNSKVVVGGRNLLRSKSDATVTSNGITVSYNASTHQYHVYGTNTKTDANWSIGPYFYSGADSYLNLSAGEAITLSTDVAGPSGAYLQLNLVNTSGNQYAAVKLTFDGSKRSATATLPSTQSPSNHSGAGFIGILSTCGSIDATFRIKLERGTKATDWSPAPEDVDASVEAAAKTATNYISVDSTGIRIADSNPANATTYQHQTATNTEFVVNNASVASFGGDGVRIGKSSESHMELDYHSMKMVNRDEETYFHISDLRDDEGYVVDTFRGDGSNQYFTLTTDAIREEITVTIDDVVRDSSSYHYQGARSLLLYPPIPSDGAEIVVRYKASGSSDFMVYTLGTRANVIDNKSHIGQYSFTIGSDLEASKWCSYAEGLSTKATGDFAHAEGYSTVASGTCSHTQNGHTIASGNYQTAIGKYNDNDSNNAFEIGNGSSDSHRSNAFAVTWNGIINAGSDEAQVAISSDVRTVNQNVVHSNGVCCSVTLNVRNDAAIANGGSMSVGTVPDGYRPAFNVYAACSSGSAGGMGCYMLLTNAGAVTVYNRSGASLAANTVLAATLTYAL